LRWGGQAFANLRIVPPGNGICHQVNLEYLARVVWTAERDGRRVAYPDSGLGMDSHTAMINSLGILGWGVGGLEGGAGALGESVAMLVPEVIGCRLIGKPQPGVTSTDLVLTVTQALRRHKVVDKFVEYFGPGVAELTLPDRATIANMSPENGSTMGFFPVDAETLRYLRLTGRDEAQVALVEAYCKAQGLWRDANTPPPEFSEVLELDLSSVEPSVSGPSRPQDRVPLAQAPSAFRKLVEKPKAGTGLKDGDVVIAAITSCTNTSNPAVMVGAGHPAVRAAFLASPPLVVAYALAGSVLVDLASDPLGEDAQGRAVYLRDVWPEPGEIDSVIAETINPALYRERYAEVGEGSPQWRALTVGTGTTF